MTGKLFGINSISKRSLFPAVETSVLLDKNQMWKIKRGVVEDVFHIFKPQ